MKSTDRARQSWYHAKAWSVLIVALMLAVNVLPAKAVPISQDANTDPGRSVQATPMTFTAVADAYVDSTNVTANYGTLTTLRGDGSPIVFSYLRFSVQGLSGTVTSATLRVFANSASGGGYDILAVSDDTWKESTLNYNNAPPVGSVLGASGSFSAGTWTSVDVTPYITSDGDYNFVLAVPGSTAVSFASRESGGNAPQLIIDTASGTKKPTPTATAQPTSVSSPTAAPTNPPATQTSVPTVGATATLPAGATLTFNPNADAFVNAGSVTSNYGTLTTLRGDGSPIVNSYLRFNVQGLSGTVTRATLRIYANSSSSSGYIIHGVSDNSWDEKTINYNNAPPIGGALGSMGSFGSGVWTSVDVTPYIVGNGSYNLALTVSNSTAISFASRESGANAPQLIVSTGSGSAATATATAVSTAVSSPTATAVKSPTPTSVATSTQTPSPLGQSIKHVFVVVMENHSYNEVWNTSSSPYITSLGNTYGRATNYRATTHPSLPNYLDLYGGSNYSITTDCSPSSSCHVNATNLADNLEAKGLTWKGYMESMPSPCYLTTSGTYAPKHNPMVYFDDIRNNATRCNAHDVPYTALAADLASAASTPNYALIVPNLCNDMHDCSVSTGDTWLKNNLPAILNSPACTVDKCLLILTWDEDDGSQSNQVLTIFAGSGAKTGGVVSSVSYTHFSMLRTIENIFGLPTQTSNDAAASPMTDLLR